MSISDLLKKAEAVLGLVPKIISTVQTVDQAIPLPGAGAAKLGLAVSILQTAYGAEQALETAVPWTSIVSSVTSIINAAVKSFNDLGLFTHKASTAS